MKGFLLCVAVLAVAVFASASAVPGGEQPVVVTYYYNGPEGLPLQFERGPFASVELAEADIASAFAAGYIKVCLTLEPLECTYEVPTRASLRPVRGGPRSEHLVPRPQ